MHLNLEITDMAGASIAHSLVITNFVALVHSQLKDSTCHVFPDNVQYRWALSNGEEKTVMPDASINCQFRRKRGNSFVNAPQFVMEVLSPSTAKYDRGDKMELYREEEISEYWIVDWENRRIEIYSLDYDNDVPRYYLFKTITEENKEELRILQFPHIKIRFDALFEGLEDL